MPFVALTTPYTPREESRPEYTPIPKGWYNAEIASAGLTERNGAEIVNLSFRVLDGPHSGRVVFADRYLLTPQGEPNEDTERFVRNMIYELHRGFEGSFRELCEALPQLIGSEIDISVGITKPRDGHPARNRVYDFAMAWTKAKRSGTGTGAASTAPSPSSQTIYYSAPPADADAMPF
jgi:hypothetical protein